MRYFAFLLLWCIFASTARAAPPDPWQPLYQATFQQHGLPPTPDGALDYLRQLTPSDSQRTRVAQWIVQLADAQYARREAATQQLLQTTAISTPLLQEAANSSDAEIRWRAQMILSQSQATSSQLLLAALKILAPSPPSGAAEDIFPILSHCRPTYLQQAAHEVLKSACTPADAGMLRQRLGDGEPAIRIAAAAVWAHHFPEDLQPLYPLLEDPDARVALEVACTLANQGDRRCLTTLVRLLDEDDAAVQAESVLILQVYTGQFFGAAAYQGEAARARAIQNWHDWLRDESATAKLHFPLHRGRSGRASLLGNTLISTGTAGQVKELSPSGETLWSFPIDAWSAEKLLNGNVLIGSYGASKVLEIDRRGDVVWQYDGISAIRAKPLPNGNILVADFSGRRVLEINRHKEIVWKFHTPEECFDAERLPNGNTLFACPNLIGEVQPDGNAIPERQRTVSGRLNGIQALPNGNLLLANYGENKVYELDGVGNRVWELDEVQPCDAFRMPDGRTLIATAARIIEVAPDGKVVRELAKANYGSARQ